MVFSSFILSVLKVNPAWPCLLPQNRQHFFMSFYFATYHKLKICSQAHRDRPSTILIQLLRLFRAVYLACHRPLRHTRRQMDFLLISIYHLYNHLFVVVIKHVLININIFLHFVFVCVCGKELMHSI